MCERKYTKKYEADDKQDKLYNDAKKLTNKLE